MTKLEKKYNAIMNFLNKNKEVVFEDGCLNYLILSCEYDAHSDILTFKIDGMREVHAIHVYGNEFDSKEVKLRIDRKYKAIEFYRA